MAAAPQWNAARTAGDTFCQNLNNLFNNVAFPPGHALLPAARLARNQTAETKYYSNANEGYTYQLNAGQWTVQVNGLGGYTRTITHTDVGLPQTDTGGGVVPFLRAIPVDGVQPPKIVQLGGGRTTLTGDYDVIDISGRPAQRIGAPLQGEPAAPKMEEYVQFMMRSQVGHNNGIVVSNHIYKNHGSLSYSDALFYSWRSYNRPNFQAAAPTVAQPLEPDVANKIKMLGYLVQFNIDNTDTQNIIEEAYVRFPVGSVNGGNAGSNVRRGWKRNYGHDDAFFALLGTPNSKFVGYLLTQHFDELRLDIVEIQTIRSTDGKYYMCFILGSR